MIAIKFYLLWINEKSKEIFVSNVQWDHWNSKKARHLFFHIHSILQLSIKTQKYCIWDIFYFQRKRISYKCLLYYFRPESTFEPWIFDPWDAQKLISIEFFVAVFQIFEMKITEQTRFSIVNHWKQKIPLTPK